MKPLSGSPAEPVHEERPAAMAPERWRLPSGVSLTEFTLRSGFLASAIVRLGAEPKQNREKPAATRQRIRVVKARAAAAPPLPER